jgi:hypothetical protein
MIVYPAESAERGFDTFLGRHKKAKKSHFEPMSVLKWAFCERFGMVWPALNTTSQMAGLPWSTNS